MKFFLFAGHFLYVFVTVINVVLAQTPEKHYLIKAGQIYDSEKSEFRQKQQILIKGNRILKVGPLLDVPPNTIVLDYSNGTVTPGLVDAHTHVLTAQRLGEPLAVDAIMHSTEHRVLRATKYLRSYLASGFTSIRDLGNSGQYLDIEMRSAVERKDISGPRMFVSGPIIGSMDGQLTTGFPIKEYDHIARSEQTLISGPDEARKAVKEHIARGVDIIKILAIGSGGITLSLEEMKAIVETAHSHRIKVTAHCDRDWAVHAAINAGVDGIEHAYDFKQSTLDTIAKRGIYIVPTYGSVESLAYFRKLANKEYKIEELRKQFSSGWGKWIGDISKAGILMVAGSDAYSDTDAPRGDIAKETIRGYFDAGLTPEEVIKSATINAAKILGMEGELGVLKENALADIVVFNGDLKKEFSKALFDVKLVIKDGQIEFRKD